MDRLTNSETSTQVLSHTLSKVMRGLVLVRKRRTLEGRTTDPKFHQRLTLGGSECRHISRCTVLIPYLAFKSTKWGCSFCSKQIRIPTTLTSQTLSTDSSQKRKEKKTLSTDRQSWKKKQSLTYGVGRCGVSAPVECGQITREEESPQLMMYSYMSLSSEVFLQTQKKKKENWFSSAVLSSVVFSLFFYA